MLIFIDESGDPGFKFSKGSSQYFAMALVAFKDVEQSLVTAQAIDELANGLRSFTEFKFSKSRPEIRDKFFEAVNPFQFSIRAIVIRKEEVYSQNLRTNKENFYNFFVKSMLKFDNGLLQNAKVVIDGSGDRAFKKELASYLRNKTRQGAIRKIAFSDSKNDRLIQLADMCVGAIARSYTSNSQDSERWQKMLKNKIDNIWDFK